MQAIFIRNNLENHAEVKMIFTEIDIRCSFGLFETFNYNYQLDDDTNYVKSNCFRVELT